MNKRARRSYRSRRSAWVWLAVLAVAMLLAAMEVAWLGDRVSTHRARKAVMGEPPGASLHLSLPLGGFKP